MLYLVFVRFLNRAVEKDKILKNSSLNTLLELVYKNLKTWKNKEESGSLSMNLYLLCKIRINKVI